MAKRRSTPPRQKQPGNARRSDGNPQGTGDAKRPIAGSLGSVNAPVPDHAPPAPVQRKAPTLPGNGYLPPQNSPEWYPPSSGSPGSRRDG